jgi:RNA polymerase sigma-70 factor (family 1)
MSDEQLVKQLQQNSEVAFRAIYDRYAQPLFDTAWQKTSRREVAEELVQDLFVTLWVRRTSLQIDHLGAYLFGALRYRVISHLREALAQRSQLLEESATPTEVPPAERALAFDEVQHALTAAIARLPEKTRHIFSMSRLEEKTHREIANTLDLSEKAVEYHITQALKSLRISLKEYLPVLAVCGLWGF